MNEVQKASTTAIAPSVEKPIVASALSSDIIIPKLLLMQGLSEFVNDRRAQQGDMVRSTTAEKLGDDKKGVDVIPLSLHNLWMLQEDARGMGKFEFRGYEPRTPFNEADPWDFVANGTKWKRTKVINLYALLPSDIDAFLNERERYLAGVKSGEDDNSFDVDKVLMPIVIPFRNTSFQAGRTVATHFTKCESLAEQIGLAVQPYMKTLPVSCVQDKNDKGTYFVYSVDAKGKNTDKKYLEQAGQWHARLQALGHSVKVDESDTSEKENNSPTSF